MDNISKRLKELRLEKNLSQMKLAKIIGVSDAIICKWEKGENEPKAGYIIKLADYFGVTRDYLLGRKE